MQETTTEYSIYNDDIYNFDETGFQIGVILTAKVIIRSNQAGRPKITQPGNREWVIAIETISARGEVMYNAVLLIS